MNRLLRLCALAYPRAERRLVSPLAQELVDDGAPVRREAAGLLVGGLEARLRLSGAPWAAALDRVALPLAGLLTAATLVGIVQTQEGGWTWIGWSWAVGLAGAVLVLTGVAAGRRHTAAIGAALVAALCALDGLRDLYGSGSRWVALWVDVLPALLPAALVLVAATTAVPARARGARPIAWTIAGTVAAVAVALTIERHTTSGTTVIAAGGALTAVMLLRALVPGAPEDRLAGAISLAVAAPAGVWSLLAALPFAGDDPMAWTLFAGLAAVAGTAVAGLARAAGRADSGSVS